ncbi:MAG: hypothetical protein EXR45_07355 [Chloroflexi bacterium]|nr:hypothetical protein [Chloroflexota bacterium]
MTSLVIGTAAGLNPYVALLVAGAIAGWTGRLQLSSELGATSETTWRIVALVAGAALAIDLTFGKVRRFAWLMRRLSETAATGAGAVGASMACPDTVPIWVAAIGGSIGSLAIAHLISRIASHGARSDRWVRMGDVPVLMGAGTAAAIIIPLVVALPIVGTALAILSLLTVACGAFIVSRQPSGPQPMPVEKKHTTGSAKPS